MDIEEMMSINVKNLASKQHKYLQKHALKVLKVITKLIEREDYDLDNLDKHISFSPSGDGYGAENHFINFHWDIYEHMDIRELFRELDDLKLAMKHSEEIDTF